MDRAKRVVGENEKFGKNEVGKFGLKLEKSVCSWKVPAEVELSFSNFARFFPIPLSPFKLRLARSNLNGNFRTPDFLT